MPTQPLSKPTSVRPSHLAAPRQRALAVGYLRAFEAVARHLNFRKAAEAIFVSQPAISRQIQALEEDLGFSLFVRHTRSVELTAAGLQLFQAVQPTLERIDQTVSQLRQRQSRPSVAITTFASFASMWAIPQLEQFQNIQPEVDFRIDASDHYVDIHRSDQDIALRLGFRADMPTDAILLFSEQLAPMAHPSVLPVGGLQSLAQLSDYTFIDNQEDPLAYLSWQSWFDLRHAPVVTPKRWVRLNYVYQILQLALAGQGLLLARLPMMAESVLRGDLVEVFPGQVGMHVEPPLCYWMSINRRSAHRPEVQALAQWLSQAAEQTRAGIAARFPRVSTSAGVPTHFSPS
jgi:LysR family transcriptional regulator, glycine cleavage system transcriptional activator